jgi:TRAP transporter 4TM/12TM fusion protein
MAVKPTGLSANSPFVDGSLQGEVITPHRDLSFRSKTTVYWIGVVASLFHLWANGIAVLPEIHRNAIHYGFILVMGFILYPALKSRINSGFRFDIFLSVLAATTALYLLFFEEALHARNQVPNAADLIFAGLALVILLELTRRTSGLFIPGLAIFFLTYALFWGKYLGGLWNFPGVSVPRMLYRMYFAPDGIFGTIATISSTFVYLFVLFGAFLLKSGAGEFMIKLSLSILGRTTGGPAKMAAVASGMLGSISGSAVANTVGSGSLTIPMMKRVGFSPTFSAAVEAAASTGGQLMPPIMGAGAFIMSQWTQIPYLTIVAVSFLPAAMYFLSVIFFIHLRARKMGIRPLNREEIPSTAAVLKEGWHFFIPLAVLVGLLMYGFTPTYAAAYGILGIVLASWWRRSTRMGITDILDALALGASNMVTTGVILLCSGIVVGVVLLVGIGIKFSLLISVLAGGSLLLTICLIALASLILGMGLPVTASYIVLAVLAAPALTGLGVSVLAAHLLIFWYSQDANVTPPVCLAAYSAAAIAGSDPLKTGLESWKIAKGLYLIPLLFCYTPILFEGPMWHTAETIAAATLGLLAFAIAFEGFHLRTLHTVFRMSFVASMLLLFWPDWRSHIAGAIIFLLLWVLQTSKRPASNPG